MVDLVHVKIEVQIFHLFTSIRFKVKQKATAIMYTINKLHKGTHYQKHYFSSIFEFSF